MNSKPCLRKIKPTAPRLDTFTSWIFSKCSYELAGIVAYIFNCSFCAGVIPEHWKQSVITPVATKPPKSVCLADFRPISVTPILSRLVRIVRKWLLPAINPIVFTSYSQPPHRNICLWNSALLIALLLFPTATITSTNIHLCYNVFLMEHINCICCCLACCSLLFYYFYYYFIL